MKKNPFVRTITFAFIVCLNAYYWTFLQKGFLCGFNKLKTCLKNSRREKHFLVKTLNPSLKIETSRV
ncbi:hypothetical protein, partial [Haliscomenobacter sp.]|uniref:hypothetical protein n=1 Tax=Haliscomenobacter sp. TaxID=2717303 RepID=UPI00359364D8